MAARHERQHRLLAASQAMSPPLWESLFGRLQYGHSGNLTIFHHDSLAGHIFQLTVFRGVNVKPNLESKTLISMNEINLVKTVKVIK